MIIFIKALSSHTTLYYHEVYEKLVIIKKIRSESIPLYQVLKEKQIPFIHEIIEIDEKNETVMLEHINGESVGSLVDCHGKLDFKKYSQAIKVFLETVDKLHHVNIIHKDIKPANIIFANNAFFLIDFDSARVFDDFKNKDTVLLGTNGFASPEHYGYQQTDERSDIYSIGAFMKYSFVYSDVTAIVVEKCLKIDPKDRYQSIKELQQGLGFETVSRGSNNSGGGTTIDAVIKKVDDTKEALNQIKNQFEQSKTEKVNLSKIISLQYVLSKWENKNFSSLKKLRFVIYFILGILMLITNGLNRAQIPGTTFIKMCSSSISELIGFCALVYGIEWTIQTFAIIRRADNKFSALKQHIVEGLIYMFILILLLVPLVSNYVNIGAKT